MNTQDALWLLVTRSHETVLPNGHGWKHTSPSPERPYGQACPTPWINSSMDGTEHQVAGHVSSACLLPKEPLSAQSKSLTQREAESLSIKEDQWGHGGLNTIR